MLWFRLRQLRSEDPKKESQAMEALVKMRRKAIAPLVIAITRMGGWGRDSAYKALQQIDPNWDKSTEAKRAIPKLVAILENRVSNHDYDKQHVLRVLGRIGDANHVLVMLRAINIYGLAQSSSFELEKITIHHGVNLYDFKEAIQAIGKIGVPAVEPLLQVLLEKKTSNDDQQAAALALEIILRNEAPNFNESDLQEISRLEHEREDNWTTFNIDLDDVQYSPQHYSGIDCSRIKALAKQELTRRNEL